MLRSQVRMLEERATSAQVPLAGDAYLFTDDVTGQAVGARCGLAVLQSTTRPRWPPARGVPRPSSVDGDLWTGDGHSVTQVAMRAGHDPSVAARHYSGRVVATDRVLAVALAAPLRPEGPDGSSPV
jgi:hypothetical protein